MIRGVVLFVPRVICAVTCVVVIMAAALPLAVLGKGKS